jgi:hypothetical protein
MHVSKNMQAFKMAAEQPVWRGVRSLKLDEDFLYATGFDYLLERQYFLMKNANIPSIISAQAQIYL